MRKVLEFEGTPTSGQVVSWDGSKFVPSTGGPGVTDHGALTGLADDDHSQYHNDARGDARYYTESEVDSALAGKANSSHTHAIADVTNLQSSLNAKLWPEYATKWSTTPSVIGTATVSGSPGDVLSYVYNSVTRYRFVADTYNPALDRFYGTYSGGILSDLLTQRDS